MHLLNITIGLDYKYLAIYKNGGEKCTLLMSFKNSNYYRQRKCREILVSLRRCPGTQICEFCYKDTMFSIFQRVYQKDHKGRF